MRANVLAMAAATEAAESAADERLRDERAAAQVRASRWPAPSRAARLAPAHNDAQR